MYMVQILPSLSLQLVSAGPKCGHCEFCSQFVIARCENGSLRIFAEGGVAYSESILRRGGRISSLSQRERFLLRRVFFVAKGEISFSESLRRRRGRDFFFGESSSSQGERFLLLILSKLGVNGLFL